MNLPPLYARLPSDARAEGLKAIVRERLGAAEKPFMDQLRLLVRAGLPKEALHLGIELDMQDMAFDPIMWCECEGFHVLCKDTPWSPPIPMYAPLIEPVPLASEQDFHEAGLTLEDWNYYGIVELECLLFIRRCWLNAGGDRLLVLATTNGHDSGWMLNLRTGEWESM